MSSKIRIVSDLHIGHKASVIESLEALRPLAEGVDWLIFNGDTLELKYGDLDIEHYDAGEQRRQFEKEAESWDCEVTLITGNHDPEISEIHSLSILNDQVFITHGDGLFREIAPWSSNIENLKTCTEHIDPQATGQSLEDMHSYLQQHKDATLKAHKLDKVYNPTLWGKFKIFLHQAWPPSTPFRILRCWREVPDRAVSLTSRFSLAPKFIVLGHTHKPGIWKRGEQTIINLGSYFPWPGALCIDIEDTTLSIRKIQKRRDSISIGACRRSFEIENEGELLKAMPYKVGNDA
ncbi:Ser/Thr protein phosphatase family protein [Verrucomicrobiia bacterium DG1235]|nr:Ser/Thr protein phosphatase family protein [Verrucomicrobiae bacterium DG1235]